ncbi:MAG: baseplate J/gp47 family protein, partial [Syntrophales bacterium]
MSFKKTFDQLLDEILTDWRNQLPGADTSQGSLIFIKSACLASALWGLYNYQDWISRQVFPDTADSEYMEHHTWVRGITRRASETDAELLARLLEYIRRPPAGGNRYDYVKWALEIDYVAAAWCFPVAQGPGTVDVVIQADADYTGSEIPTSHTLTGTVSGTAENKLVDAGGGFSGIVRPGDIAVNNDLGTEAEVTAVDSDTQLTLSSDIFTAAAQAYTLQSLTVQVKEYIDTVRPVTASVVRVLPPTVQTENV